MLTRRIIAAVMAAVALVGLTAPTASGDASGGAFMNEDTVVISVGVSGESGSSNGGRGSAGGSGGPTGCYMGGAEIPCFQWGVAWRPDLECYARVKPVQPPLTDAVWGGNEDGVILECRIGTEGGWNSSWDIWTATAVLPAPPDPAVLAARAVERMQLSAIRMGTFPEQAERAPMDLGYVGWNVWMWVDDPTPASWGPITRSVSERGYTVTATGHVDKVVWDMGNGDTVTCQLGKPWISIWVHNEASPDCGYLYERDGEYTVSATTYWVVNWSGIGQTGTITAQLTQSGTLRIAEVQVVNVTTGD